MLSRLGKKLRVLFAGGALSAIVPAWIVAGAVENITQPRRKPVPQVTSIGGAEPRFVSFPTQDGLMLRAWYVPPRNGATIILAHGHGETRAQMLPEASFLVKHGYGILAFDWRAHGGSEGDESTRGDKERWDLDAALGFLSKAPDAGSSVVGALGFSRGGNVLVEVAPHEPRIKALVAEAVAASPLESLRQDVGPRKLPLVLWVLEWKGMNIKSRGPAVSSCDQSRPMLVVAGAKDPVLAGTKTFFETACGPKELWVVPGAAHGGYATIAPVEYETRIVAFFDRWLLASGERASVER